ncbi:MAG: hypothetical protein JO029_01730 [Candidatus Eremiobacteraeota bacterium]|nr:hypothetical protein [Candidatus Eremiobacteraeota bacterium]MBV8331148.1 hypothetical protein [Candidatus Eremiobacteraeota bacterium]MBV8432981.1 hypothetical protein [Candidatus Eremiobacteraeota bacterium]MBV8583934.1 hypothetical protein [Candidatus Eremiobacteraeota bacterium]
MPKRVSILFAGFALALAFAACNNSSSTITPTPAPSGTITPNPKDRSAAIEVTILQSPAPHIPVQISTPRSSSSPRPGTPFATQNTGKKGMTIFRKLNPTKTYCWVAQLGSGQTSSTCASWDVWQTSIISLGT